MALTVLGQKQRHCTLRKRKTPSSMDRGEPRNANEHVIDIASMSNPASQPQQNRVANSRPRQRNPLNSGRWISMELFLLLCQITAAIVVLILAKEENPRVPLRVYIVGYAAGCVAIFPILYWRFRNRNYFWEPDVGSQLQVDSSLGNENVGPASRTSGLEGENGGAARGAQSSGFINPRHRRHVEYFKLALDFIFAILFVLGIVWIFRGYTSDTESPYLYRLSVVFLAISFVGYAMPFLLCATICCCLPCIISVLGVREELAQTRGATRESINALPTYKFKVRKNKSGNDRENSEGEGEGEGGIVAAGTEKERAISAEDAVCCVCLANFEHNDELRELPCFHFFHKECIDQWLQINASCPLCKSEAGQPVRSSIPEATAEMRNG